MKLNKSAYEHTKELIRAGHMVFDERDAWSEHQPSAEKENESSSDSKGTIHLMRHDHRRDILHHTPIR